MTRHRFERLGLREGGEVLIEIGGCVEGGIECRERVPGLADLFGLELGLFEDLARCEGLV